jgi:hypothetical protein
MIRPFEGNPLPSDATPDLAVLLALVRLLARQAACAWLERPTARRAGRPSATLPTGAEGHDDDRQA